MTGPVADGQNVLMGNIVCIVHISVLILCRSIVLVFFTLPVRNVIKNGPAWASFSPIRFVGKTRQQLLLFLSHLERFVQTVRPKRPDAAPAERSLSQA